MVRLLIKTKKVIYHYYIFSKCGFTEGLKGAAARDEVTLVSLEDMY